MANAEQLEILLSGVEQWNKWRRKNHSVRLDFTGAELKEQDLSGSNLVEADFTGANLINTDLSLSRLYGAKFINCKLISTNFQGAHLMDADLSSSNANGADFRNAFLMGTKMENSSLYSIKYNRWAIYRGIRLSGCWGNQIFLRFAHDQSYIEEFRGGAAARPLIKVNGRFHYLRQCIAHIKTISSLRKQRPKKYKSWILYLLWSITSDCGRSFSLWFLLSLLFIALFGIAYAGYSVAGWLPESWANFLIDIAPSIDIQDRPSTKYTPYYISFITLTSLGFGDVVPKNLPGEIWLTIEGIFGFIMLGGLISIFASKVTRRSI